MESGTSLHLYARRLIKVGQGDSKVCDRETADGKKVSVLVTFSSDGSYIWEEQ